ncbi:hypothetical protein HNP73_004585 [Amaricoccus macauensis]|uniref:Uncharacterized protein n=1 Tax=Amaricoccus macauensis TaxID=57001 RepID=A0A840STU2_9RHOB|nr:hypothetical protein [Amaricoccus macauensis]MBB5224614.1 hypothetical protein [Amaricoccus macauensis]
MRMRAIAAVGAGILAAASGAQAAGSFVCERSPTVEVAEQVGGNFALQNIVNEYRVRWDAVEARRECEAFAAGQPSEISCLNGRRDWTAIMASVPGDYFGQSNKALAATYRKEMQRGNGFKEAMAYCRSVGAIE